MRKTKVVIKCNGLTVRTQDLLFAEGAIDHLVRNGIMEHVWFPKKLLDETLRVLNNARSMGDMAVGTMKVAMDKIREHVRREVADEPVNEVKESEPIQKRLPAALERIQKMFSWTIEEDKYLCDNLDVKPDVLAKDPTLSRHTKQAIKTRLSLMKNRKFDRLNKDRANMMQAYVSGKKVSTPVADIKRKRNDYRKGVNVNYWTPEETQLLKDNADLPGKELAKLFPGRTLAAVVYKRRKMGDSRPVVKISSTGKKIYVKGKWTEDEIKSIRLNMSMTPEQLTKLPWLKNKTKKQIGNMQWQIKSGRRKE